MVETQHALAGADTIVAAELGGRGRSARVFLGAAIERADVEQHFADDNETDINTTFDAASGSIRTRRTRRLGAITLAEHASRDVPPDELADAAAEAVRRHGISILPWPDSALRLRERMAFLHAHEPEDWPDVSDAALSARLDDWLIPWLTPAGIAAFDTTSALMSLAGWQRRAGIDQLAPIHVEVPSGSRIRIDYSDPSSPVLAVRLQEMFGAADTPRVSDGRVPLTLHLLSPAGRPVQVTRDLAGFWSNTYFDVRKDLRGRYPKHYWPDDPRTAQATRRTRPR
jgi:ATP-dependent helicase HrpB